MTSRPKVIPNSRAEDAPISDKAERIRIEQHSVAGTLWFASWLFTIGFLDLTFWRGVFPILLWPYYIGVAVSGGLAGGR